MPTLFTHPAVPLALAVSLPNVSNRLLLSGIAASVIPDADVIAFRFGIPYASEFGHRGFTHSLAFAALVALIGMWRHRDLLSTRWQAFWFLFAAGASHGLLDAVTNGGLGIALLWPFDSARYFAPLRYLEVSPIGASFFSTRGWRVLQSELIGVWLPLTFAAAGVWFARGRIYRTTR